ncbi:MAG: LysM peptidoglycan-binding domain-containing protein [Candidatus Dormibacteria bacterium]
MIADYAPPLYRSRRRGWQRSPRLVAAGIAAAVIGSLALGGQVYGSLSSTPPATVHVRAGDTLWSIAAAHYPGGDIRARVDAIISFNNLGDGTITPGEVIALPAA